MILVHWLVKKTSEILHIYLISCCVLSHHSVSTKSSVLLENIIVNKYYTFFTSLTLPMDSITQFTLGAVIGQIVGWRQYGIKAWLIGWLIGTIPDLDVFVGPLLYSDDILQSELFHRSVTHSFFLSGDREFSFCGNFSLIPTQTLLSKVANHHHTVIPDSYDHRYRDVLRSLGTSSLLITSHLHTQYLYRRPDLYTTYAVWSYPLMDRRPQKTMTSCTVDRSCYLYCILSPHLWYQILCPPSARRSPTHRCTHQTARDTRTRQHHRPKSHHRRWRKLLPDPVSHPPRRSRSAHTIYISKKSPPLDRKWSITHRRPDYLVRQNDDGAMMIQSVAMGPLGTEYGVLHDKRLFGRVQNPITETLSRDERDGRQAGDSISYSRKRLFHSQSELLDMIEEDF